MGRNFHTKQGQLTGQNLSKWVCIIISRRKFAGTRCPCTEELVLCTYHYLKEWNDTNRSLSG